VLGVATFIRNIKIERKHMVDSAEMLLLISLIPLALLATHTTNVSHGLVLLVVFVLYVFFIVKEKYKIDKKVRVSKKDVGFEVGLFLAGILLVVVGARFLVNAATLIAGEWGFSGAGIGLTLVSFGTTLPELMIDFTAIRKGEVALAIGEILGSSVVNLTLILGAALSLGSQAIDFSQFVIPAAFIVIANSFLVYNMIKHEGIGKAQGIVFLGMYVLFIGIELALHASGARV
jgi:cation:H+ antiporter